MIKDLALTSLETITVFDFAGKLKFVLDELQKASFSNEQETADITGKGGRLLSRLKKNKSASISGTSGLISGGLLGMQMGTDFESKTSTVLWTDYLTVSSGAASTQYKAVGTTGAEIKQLYLKNSDGTLGEELTQGSTAEAGVFTYSPSTKALAFHTDVDDGTEIVVYYTREIEADVLSNNSDLYSTKGQVYIDALAEDKCNNVYRVQIYIPKADFEGAFSMELGDGQSVHDFEAKAQAGACGTDGSLWTYTVFGVGAEDAA